MAVSAHFVTLQRRDWLIQKITLPCMYVTGALIALISENSCHYLDLV